MNSTHHKLKNFLDGRVKRLLIDGKHLEAADGQTFETSSPATGKVVAEVARGGAQDIDLAVAAARRAFVGEWSKFKPFDRQRVLLRLADLVDENFDLIAHLDALDMGAPIANAPGKQRRAVALLRYYAGLATNLHGQTIDNSVPGEVFSFTLREAVGVVGAITPWNGPSGMAIWKIAPALAAGCTLVVKPAEQSPLSTLLLGELCLEAGIPPGVVNIVPGFGEAGASLAAHPDVDKIAFTGSTEVGKRIIQASAGNIKRVSVELGGKSANIVFDDADLDIAVPGCAMAVFLNSGQVCYSGTRLYVQQSIYDKFVDKLASYANALKVGDPLDPSSTLGPVASKEQFDRVSSYLEHGRSEGARAAAGGHRLDDKGREAGYFIAPTVFTDVHDGMRIAREEIFGPVISAMPFKDIDEVIARGNDSEYGLGGGVWSRDVNRVLRVAKGLRTGSVWANAYHLMDPAVPFGGYKMSGYGRESGTEHMDEYLNTKSVWIKTA